MSKTIVALLQEPESVQAVLSELSNKGIHSEDVGVISRNPEISRNNGKQVPLISRSECHSMLRSLLAYEDDIAHYEAQLEIGATLLMVKVGDQLREISSLLRKHGSVFPNKQICRTNISNIPVFTTPRRRYKLTRSRGSGKASDIRRHTH